MSLKEFLNKSNWKDAFILQTYSKSLDAWIDITRPSTKSFILNGPYINSTVLTSFIYRNSCIIKI